MNSALNDPNSGAMAEVEQALAAGSRETALRALGDVARDDPDHDEAPLLAAMIHLQDGKPFRAAELALDALQIRPFHPRAWTLLACACTDALHPALAIEIYEYLLRTAPGLRGTRRSIKASRRALRMLRGSNHSRRELRQQQQRLPEERIRALLNEDRSRVTAAILVGDEPQDRLALCIESLSGLADEILVLTDSVPAGPAGGQFLQGAPGEDQADRWNRLSRRARSDWILFVRASETLEPESIESLRRATCSKKALAHLLQVRTARDSTSQMQLRLARNMPGLSHKGPGTARLLPALRAAEAEWGLSIESCPGVFDFDAAPVARKVAIDRERERLESAASDDPDENTTRLELARFDFEQGQYTLALESARAARNTIEKFPRRRRSLELEEPVVLEGCCLMRLQREPELAGLMAEYHERFPATASTLFLQGIALKVLGRTEEAVDRLQSALDMLRLPSMAPAIAEVRSAALPTLLGATLLDRGATVEARLAFSRAILSHPDDLQAALGLIAVRHAEGELEQVLRELDRLVIRHGDDPLVWLAGAILLGDSPLLATAAVGWLEEARRRFPERRDICRRLGEAQLRAGMAQDALETWDREPAQTDAALAAEAVAALACGKGLPAMALESGDSIGSEMLVWFERWMKYGAPEALDSALLDIRRADTALPGFAVRTAEWLERIGQNEAADQVRARMT